MATTVVLNFLVGMLCMVIVTALHIRKSYRFPLPPGPPRIALWGSLASVVFQLFSSYINLHVLVWPPSSAYICVEVRSSKQEDRIRPHSRPRIWS